MEFHQLRTFLAIAEEGRLSNAAERLNLSPPAVSAHVKSLEEELGVSLFLRTPRGMRLTDAGRAILPAVMETLARAKEIREQAARHQGALAGPARIGLNTDPAFLHVAEFMELMRKRHSNLEIHFFYGLSGELLEDLSHDRLDAAYIFEPDPPPWVRAERVHTTKLLVVSPMAWEEKVAKASLAELAELPWVLTPPKCPYRRIADHLFAKEGVSPAQVVITDHESTLRSLVSKGMGLTVMREDEALAAQAAGLVALWPKRKIKIVLSLAYQAKRDNDPLIMAIASAVRGAWGVERGRKKTPAED